jgi:aminopeptidase Y
MGDYYTLTNQTFSAVTGDVFESRLVVDDKIPQTYTTFSLTPATRDRQPVTGLLGLALNDGCSPGDYQPAGISNKIVLIARGNCSFSTKSALAGKAGAIAAIVYGHDDERIYGTLGWPLKDHVATFGISGTEGLPLVAKVKAGEAIEVTAYIDAVVREIATHNIVAQTIEGDPENCVMLGGHSDSVSEGPGINDDGSGTLSLLEVATQLSKFRVNNCVRFAWLSGEEEGLLGSDHYVDQLSKAEKKRIRLFMDYDMLASPNYAYQVYNATNAENPVGSEELRDLYTKWYDEHGLNWTFVPFDGRSDYDGFIRGGIPAGGIATGAEGIKTDEEQKLFGGKEGIAYDPCYHSLCDDVKNPDVEAWEINTKVSLTMMPSLLCSSNFLATVGCSLRCDVCSLVQRLPRAS